MRKTCNGIHRRLTVWLVVFLCVVVSQSLTAVAAETSDEDSGVTMMLNPFSLERIAVQPQASKSVIVLRSTSVRQVDSAALSSMSLGGAKPIFRNSVVRIPIQPDCRSTLTPE